MMLGTLLVVSLQVSYAKLGKVKKINPMDTNEIRSLVQGGAPWVVMCSDMKDNNIATDLATNSVTVLADDDIHVGIMKCRQKMEGGKSFVQKFGLKAKKGNPLIFVAANGDRPKQLDMPAYAKLVTEKKKGKKGKKDKKDKRSKGDKKKKKGKKAKKKETKAQQYYQPDVSILTKSVIAMARIPKVGLVSKQSEFHEYCLYKKHCVVAAINGKLPASHPTATALRRLSKKYRNVRFAIVDQKRVKFSHDKLLPDAAKGSEANEPRLLVLQRLSKKESRRFSVVDLPPAVVDEVSDTETSPQDANGVLGKDIGMSLCADKLDKDMGSAAVHAVFEKHRVKASTFLGESEGKTGKAAVRMAKILQSRKLLFRVRDKYLTWDAAAPYLVSQLMFGATLAPQAMGNLRRIFPLKNKGKAPKFAATALERDTIPESKADNFAELDKMLRAALKGTDETVPVEASPKISKRKEIRDKERAEAKKMRKMRRSRARRRTKDKQAAKEKQRQSAKKRKQQERERLARERIEEETRNTMPQMADEEDIVKGDSTDRRASQAARDDEDEDDDEEEDDDDAELNLDENDDDDEEVALDDDDDEELNLDDDDDDAGGDDDDEIEVDDDDLFFAEDED